MNDYFETISKEFMEIPIEVLADWADEVRAEDEYYEHLNAELDFEMSLIFDDLWDSIN